jgi:alanine racemase
MTFSLYVDRPRWRAHTDLMLAQTPGLVPVVKGNGYGFGRTLLAAESARLDVDVLAVGEPQEVASVRADFDGSVLVMSPYLDGSDVPAEPDDRVVHTAATRQGLAALAGHRVVVELQTSMRRFGFSGSDLDQLSKLIDAVQLEGFALHLPMEEGDLGREAETQNAITRLRLGGLPVETLWVSHLSATELTALQVANPDVTFRSRIGTRLWLGDRGAASARATVLAVHALRRGDRYGYRQRRAPRSGHLLVVAAGTSHGIALSAPSPAAGLTQRARTVAIGGLEAVGRSLSPFLVDGAQRWFAEPPHMQVSMVWLPRGRVVPAVGTELDTDVRMTTTTFDRVVMND